MIKNYENFIVESINVDKLKHLEHAEDHIIHGGNEGVAHAADNLDDLHNLLTGKKSKSKLTVKYDGSPSVVFGINPETNKFFVASKSAFNVNPKLNYNEKDIEANHGHAPGLVTKLKAALQHLPKVMPKDGGVYQGDFLYEKPDVNQEGDKFKFAPNTITYSSKVDSPQGRKIAASKIGFVVHTKYKGKVLSDMKAGFDVDHSKFKQDPDVNLVNPEVNDTSNSKYTPELKNEFKTHREAADEAYRNTGTSVLEGLSQHDAYIKPYINQTVRDGTTPNAEDYIKHLQKKKDVETSKVKTEIAKEKKSKVYNALIDDIEKNKEKYKSAFLLHHHLQKAKDVLVKALGNPTEFEHSVGGKLVKPEGFVSIRGGKPTKLVDRSEFSRLNFANNRGKGEPEATTPEEGEVRHVFAFGRMNPPTVGHGALVDKVKELASAQKAKHTIVLSHSTDPEKNPLSPEEKLKHAKRFFPGTNITTATDDEPTFIHHLKKLNKQGVTHVTMVAGSDRIEEYKKLLDRYNKAGGEFNFKHVDVVSAGERDPDAEGVEGMSASKMRDHAISNKFSEFKKGIPSHVHPEHAKELYNDVRKAMDIKIGPETPGVSLARYAKRNDPIGVRARAEQQRRQLLKKKKLKEETEVIQEVRLRTDISKKAVGFANKKFLGKPIEKMQSKFNETSNRKLSHHSTMEDGRKVYHGIDHDGHHHFMTVDHNGHVDSSITAIKKGKAHDIDMAVAKPGAGVHKLYHHLITKHNAILTTSEQSLGGFSVWKKMRKMGDVNVHGYHSKTGKGERVDILKHPEESHVTDSELSKTLRTPGGTRSQRKKEYQHVKNTQNMILVAHKNKNIRPIKEMVSTIIQERRQFL